MARRLGRRRWVWPVATAAGLVLVGRVLVGEVGSPVRLLRALGDLGGPWADPVAAMISLLALLAENVGRLHPGRAGARALCLLPGSVGRVAWRVTLLVTPVVVRRLLDLLVGGALLAQATLATTSGMPSGHRAAVPALAIATSSVSGGPAAPATGYDLGPHRHDLGHPASGHGPARRRRTRPDAARPPPVIGATAALAGGRAVQPRPGALQARVGSTSEAARRPTGKAEPGSRVETDPGSAGRARPTAPVAVGDTLWDIAAARLVPGERTVLNVHRYWRQVYRTTVERSASIPT